MLKKTIFSKKQTLSTKILLSLAAVIVISGLAFAYQYNKKLENIIDNIHVPSVDYLKRGINNKPIIKKIENDTGMQTTVENNTGTNTTGEII